MVPIQVANPLVVFLDLTLNNDLLNGLEYIERVRVPRKMLLPETDKLTGCALVYLYATM